ncbi:TetR family transcriptional regulator C-terminal domain-containing protein [Kineosporia sp. J2-2]|uniref:TetR family transcriptional regulator C-terminal domain-containing protein n=1 Tax=Kineosporia corallincola TaxID=2835133 RepID=A0ABS5TKC0_9ACTN|nr:TetR family transcriptional regulator C-terminal domain-containing protein [Kineosporia corallincola]MBT0771547.1 TetR family transcriptional regulator C-terminal domain-containing protein [Kineosporia corallincola]
MPKIVDHDERRAQIVDATMRVVEQVGLEGTTIRAIAREAGCSTGVLAHYFKNKADILVTAHLAAFSAVRDRIAEHQADTDDAVALMRLALEEACPLDRPRLLEAGIDVSFWGLALHDEHLKEVRRRSHIDAIDFWESLVAGVVEQGRALPGASARAVAVETVLLIDGLSVNAVLFPDVMDAERQLAVIDEHLRSFVARG